MSYQLSRPMTPAEQNDFRLRGVYRNKHGERTTYLDNGIVFEGESEVDGQPCTWTQEETANEWPHSRPTVEIYHA